MLVRDGAVLDLSAHLERLGTSARELYGRDLPLDLERRVVEAAHPHRRARLRVVVAGEAGPQVEVDSLPDVARDPEPVRLAPVLLPGGLGDHKWLDRRLLDELAHRFGAVALLVDLDGEVLEAAHANVWIREGSTLVTPPLDGRLLPGTVRARLLTHPPPGLTACEEPVPLERAATADELLLSSSLRGLHPAVLAGTRAGRAQPPLVSAVR
jgi:para-aminobenzoate synthetase/4-amino-4-deoxychorismate lyase